jgi:hypothetical protein
MGILSSFFDVVAGVSILAGRSSLLDTNLTTIAGRNFTVRGALGLSFLSVGFINLWATSRKQRKIERLTKDAETFDAESFSAERKKKKSGCLHFKNGKHLWAYSGNGAICVDCGLTTYIDEDGKKSYGTRSIPFKGNYDAHQAESFSAPAAVMRTYKGRKSPALSAKSVKVGTRKRGNDGKMWQVRSVKSRGKRTQRWFKD